MGGRKLIVDAHNHVGVRIGRSQTGEELVARMDRAGVDKAVIFPFIERPDNDFIAQAVSEFPNRLIGFACVNPWADNAIDEIERAVRRLHLKGLKLHPVLHGFAMDNHGVVDPIFKKCMELDIPIIAHGTGDNPFSMPHQFEEMARTFPDVTLIMAHAGFMQATDQAIRTAKRCKNVILDMTAANSVDVSDSVEAVGPERVLLGSDTPFMDLEVEMLKVKLALPDPAARKLVMGENILRILRML
jgi:predicted TIM-barrel fold metal-dependent hydrolase